MRSGSKTRRSKKSTRKTAARGNTRSRSSGTRSRSSSTAQAGSGGSRRYGAKAASKVERSMHEMKRGQLRSGRSGKKVTSRKQAIAIGLSEARQAGAKVPRQRAGR
jgi:hypothetical protein